MPEIYLGQTCENADGFRLVAFHSPRAATHDSNEGLLNARSNLLATYANYLDMKAAVAERRANLIVGDVHARSGQLLECAAHLLSGYERDLLAIESMLRAAEKTVEGYDTLECDAETTGNYRLLAGLMRQQAQGRIDLIDLNLFQDILTQYAAMNIVP